MSAPSIAVLRHRLARLADPVRPRARTLLDWMSQPRALTSIAFLRVIVGVCGIGFYLADHANRHLLFAPGILESESVMNERLGLMGSATLYSLAHSPAVFELLYHAGLLAAIAVTFGVGGRVAVAIHYVLIWSVYAANPLLLDGGDNLVMILGILLLFTRCTDRLSLGPLLRRRLGLAARRPAGVVAAGVHNAALLTMAGQICIVYLMAGLYKVQGRLWQDGTALYYVLRVPEFTWPGVTEYVLATEWLLVIGAYATVWLSIYFPLLVLFRPTRLLAVVAMTGFHLSIAVLMGLTSFALIMIACDLLFVNSHLERLVTRIRSGVTTLARRRLPTPERPPRPAESALSLAKEG